MTMGLYKDEIVEFSWRHTGASQ